EAEVEIMFGHGIDKLGDLVNIAGDLDILQKSGSWYSYNGERIGQGKEKTVAYLHDKPETIANVRRQVMDAVRNKPDIIKNDSVKSAEPGGDEA
ncbi:MAG: recombinase RecA, partial [Trueperaceae bacterium]